MKPARSLISVLMVCSGLVLAQGASQATAAGTIPRAGVTPTQGATPTTARSQSDQNLVNRLRDDARGSVSVTREDSTHRFGFVAAGRNGDLMPSVAAAKARPADKSRAFLDEYGALLGATDPTQLHRTDSSTDRYGSTQTYVQRYRGVPVFGAMIRTHLDPSGNLTAVNGTAVPNLSLSVTPRLTQAEADKAAVRAVRSDPPTDDAGNRADTSGLKAVSTQLVVYRNGLFRGATGDTQLAYVVEVSNRANIRDMVILNADAGKVVNRYSMVDDAMERHVYERTYSAASEVWKEGDPFPAALNTDQQNIVRASGEAYHFFLNSFGRDSYDGKGAPQRTVNNDPRISCPNANWNGVTTNYCNGVTADDVVAHEWGHAYTEYTDGLVYQWQPGALNESYSDIWGETVDLINGRMDGDEGDVSLKRPDGLCSLHSPALPQLRIVSPADIAKICATGGASFGPALDSTGITGPVVQGLDDTAAPGPSTTDGCSPLTNPAAVSGKIALIDRGGCAFTVKTKNAQNAGAVAVVIGNTVDAVNGMSGVDPAITIPTVMIKLSDRNLIVNKLNASTTVTVLMKDATTSQKADSYRWLIGEDATAFGGAIRDMWTPTCHGDPGKVSDAEYYCASDDQGGVHSNSGVPNHGYALLVDGGSYNGFTIRGIGLTKAAHIYWRAQTEYQTPTTDFTDHADSLEASCADLVGQTVTGLSVDGSPEQDSPSKPTPDATITSDDCAQVAAMTQAVELRKDPTQCNFQPLLAKNTPAPCASTQKKNVVWSENFSDGLAGWSVDSHAVYAGGPNFPWAADTTLPSGRSGSAAFALDASGGSCNADANDHSGVTTLTSPAITLPGALQKAPKVTFQHYVATEAGFDGGNVKISINGGPFTAVSPDAFTFNKPSTLATAAAGNTNPLAGQPGFTGTDGGEITGSWGESQIDLSMVGAKPDDTISLRFDFGQDGCSGVDGWYVDDVTVLTCKPKTGTQAARETGTTATRQS